MKRITLLSLLIIVVHISYAQVRTIPKNEFTVELSSYSIDIKPGETKDVIVYLNRSKSYSRANATLNLSSGLPEGITITFEPSDHVAESSVAHVVVTQAAKTGTYPIVLNGTILNKNKGATLKIAVSNGSDVSKVD